MPDRHFEYEQRFAPDEFDLRDVLRRARQLGAVGAPTRTLLINTSFTMPGRPDMFVRLRNVITASKHIPVQTLLTVKRKVPNSAFEAERETYVSDAVQAMQLLEMMGCVRDYTNEKFRDVLEVPGLGELDIDHYPGLPPCLEVECPTKNKLDRLLKLLGIDKAGDGSRGKLGVMYNNTYGVAIQGRDMSGDLTFASPSNIPRYVTHDVIQFRRILQEQRATAAAMKKGNFSKQLQSSP
jgi:adenylate cyclase class IV